MAENENCTHDCSTCQAACESRTQELKAQLNKFSHVNRVIAVSSGKGGVGKSTVTAMLALLMKSRGYSVGILDADILGPSIPGIFGLKEQATADEKGIYPVNTKNGIPVMSVNLLMEDPTQPVIWRGPVLAGVVKQFWTDVIWGDIDFLFIDMPPGTGDVPLTVYQSLPIDGTVTVTTPQELVSVIVSKAVNMASAMDIPLLGMVENMSYVHCPNCGKDHAVFGESRLAELAGQFDIPVLGRLPIDPRTSTLCDEGRGDELDTSALVAAVPVFEALDEI